VLLVCVPVFSWCLRAVSYLLCLVILVFLDFCPVACGGAFSVMRACFVRGSVVVACGFGGTFWAHGALGFVALLRVNSVYGFFQCFLLSIQLGLQFWRCSRS
jgi:hypothetical protein